MPAYVIVETDITDPARYEEYRKLTPAAIAAHGGRFLVRGGALEVLEGDWTPRRMVMLEFPDMATARRFYDSPEYVEARRVREGAARLRMVLADGL
jgi:uncharacterized protein (DUF1330 family)